MLSTNLQSNVLTFQPSEEEIVMYFSNEPFEHSYRIYTDLLPDYLLENLGFGTEVQLIYTSFNQPQVNLNGLSLYLKDCKLSFVKKYHNALIGNYFKQIGVIVNHNFIHDVMVWIPSSDQHEAYEIFDKYTFKAQFRTLSDGHELLLSYDGISQVLKKTVNALHELQPESIAKVLQDGKLYKYHQSDDHNLIDNDSARPVINLDIRRDLKMSIALPDRGNKYRKYIDKISIFKNTFLDTAAFAALIQLSPSGFTKLSAAKISTVRQDSNQLLFANGFMDKDARQGIKKGPFAKSPYTKVHFFFIFHEDYAEQARSLNSNFRQGLGFFKGLENFTKVHYHTENNFSIRYQDKENPLPEIKIALDEKIFKPDVEYFAIYISPFDKHEPDRNRRSIYYQIKNLLLNKSIHSQVIVASKMNLQDPNAFGFSLVNISIAALAKLGGTPWRIKSSLKNELVVGVGAFRHQDSGLQYVGSAFSFQNNGQFNEFDCFVRTNTAILAGAIHEALIRFTNINSSPERLIIHFYKDMSQKEIRPILDKLHNLGLDIPVFIVTINKTESSDVIAWDLDSVNHMPLSGTFINTGQKEFLLFNNTRYDEHHKAADGYPFPVKIKISCIKTDLLSPPVVRELIDQVYQFSRMYWKSVKQQHLPVTIKYPEMVAEIFPHFNSLTLPEFGRDKLWFL